MDLERRCLPGAIALLGGPPRSRPQWACRKELQQGVRITPHRSQHISNQFDVRIVEFKIHGQGTLELGALRGVGWDG